MEKRDLPLAALILLVLIILAASALAASASSISVQSPAPHAAWARGWNGGVLWTQVP
ncbi:MAG: hypothetical protein LBG62_04810 [Candidatus Methanoplasma sp.]|jgi:anti-sigma factor RsiW|nr:hypothetical protein [Candidatus Methanoplasma sp.]